MSSRASQKSEAGLVRAVIMAGGPGSRLGPLTVDTPKPLLCVDGRPIMEHIVEHLRVSGVQRITVTTHYHNQKIVDHFADGSRFGLHIDYFHEHTPLGTAGALGLLDLGAQPALVMNGDVMTRVDLSAMLAFHRANRSIMTVAAKEHALPVPYGVLETVGGRVQGLAEKPTLRCWVSAGVYVVEPAVRDSVAPNCALDMPDLIQSLIDQRVPVHSFPVSQYWRDIGHVDDYEQVQRDVSAGLLG